MKFQSQEAELDQSRFYQFSFRVGIGVIRRKKLIALGAFLMLLISFFGIFNIQVESDEVRYLKNDNEFRVATESIQDNLGGIASLDIIIEGKEKDFFKKPEVLKVMENLQRFCEKDELVSYSLSLVDLLKRINFVLHDNDPAYERLAKEIEEVHYSRFETINGKKRLVEKIDRISGFQQNAQFLLLYEMNGGESIDQYVDKSFQTARINVRLRDMSSRELKNLVTKIRPYFNQQFAGKASVQFANHYIWT